MGSAKRIIAAWPLTVIMLASFGGFALSAAVPGPWSLVLFYMVALPYYLGALVVSAVSQSLGVPASWFVVFGVAFALDIGVLLPLLRLAERGTHGR